MLPPSARSRDIRLLLTLLAAACSPATDTRGVVRSSRGDTTVITSPALGVRGAVQLDELRRVSPRGIELQRVSAGALGDSGTLWLVDDAAPGGTTILLLDSTGTVLAHAGREGSGPGEYRAPLRIFRLHDGTMLAKEMSTTRAVHFARDGRVLATLALPPSVATGWVVTPDTAGGWYITSPFEDNRPERVGRFGWLHFDAQGTVRDTVHPPAVMLNEPTPDGIAPGRIRTVGRDGSALTVVPGPNRLTRYRRDGRVEQWEWPGEGAPYADDERRDMQLIEDRMSELLGKPKASLPARKQPANRILTDGAGQVWVQLSTTGTRIPDADLPKGQGPLTIKWREHDRWAAFSADGALQFVVELPLNARLLDRDGDLLLGVLADDDGAEQVVVWRVRAQSAAGAKSTGSTSMRP
jgi:hypothetical protein